MTNRFNWATNARLNAPNCTGPHRQNADGGQFMTAREQVEHGHRTRGEPTYAELQAINAELLAALH